MKRNFNPAFIASAIGLFILGITLIPLRNNATTFHSFEELEYFKTLSTAPPLDSAILFPTAKTCAGCHGHDNNGYAYIDNEGNDVNIYDDWRSSMMANSAKDPFWRAKVSHEIMVNPNLKDEIETKCTSCHAPQGHNTHILRGAAHYTMDSLLVDSIGLDGVSCGACHQIKPDNLGETFSGEVNYDTNRVVYGPYELPFNQPMMSFIGFNPMYSPHVKDAGMCASCHTLITETLDLNGNPTGDHFVEQATYHEWLNSEFSDPKLGQTCQDCHMPSISDSVVISANFLFLQGRSPFALHELVGGNTMMLELMKEHRDTLGIDASPEHFDETIAATKRLLQTKTLDMNLVQDTVQNDTAYFELALTNKAGHKFPSGYPSRRATVEFVVVTEQGDTLFQSGVMDETFEVAGHDAHYEPHHDIINSEDQVQIYQIVNGDVNDQFTTVLERAKSGLKDNRIPPKGFKTTHQVYDTTLITGLALIDENFNKFNGFEGSGKDIIHYQIPLNGYTGKVDVSAKVYYQSLPPRWLAPMFEQSSAEIDFFKSLYDAADRSPVLIVSQSLIDLDMDGMTAVDNLDKNNAVHIYPNPTKGKVFIELANDIDLKKVSLFDVQGRLIGTYFEKEIELLESGIFILKIETSEGTVFKKIIK